MFVSQRLPAVTQWAGGSWLSGVRSLDCAGLGEAMPHSASMLVRSLAAKMIQTAEAVAARDAALDRPTCPGLLALPRLSNHPRDRNPGKGLVRVVPPPFVLKEKRSKFQSLTKCCVATISTMTMTLCAQPHSDHYLPRSTRR